MSELRARCLEKQGGNIPSEDAQNLQRLQLCFQRFGDLLGRWPGKSAVAKKLNCLLDEYFVIIRKSLVAANTRLPRQICARFS